jgi:hypothetical protein
VAHKVTIKLDFKLFFAILGTSAPKEAKWQN